MREAAAAAPARRERAARRVVAASEESCCWALQTRIWVRAAEGRAEAARRAVDWWRKQEVDAIAG